MPWLWRAWSVSPWHSYSGFFFICLEGRERERERIPRISFTSSYPTITLTIHSASWVQAEGRGLESHRVCFVGRRDSSTTLSWTDAQGSEGKQSGQDVDTGFLPSPPYLQFREKKVQDGEWERDRERISWTLISHLLIHSQMAATARFKQGQSQEPGASSWSPTYTAGTKHPGQFLSLPQAMDKKLDWKCSV